MRLARVLFPFCSLLCCLFTSREKSFDKNEVEANLNINGYPRNILVPDIAILAERHNDKFQARAVSLRTTTLLWSCLTMTSKTWTN